MFNMFKRFARGERGFTMIEMMVVLIIIAVLIGVGIKFYSGYIENARVTKAKTQIITMQAALDAYYAEKNVYPASDTELLNAGIKPGSGSWANPRTLDSKDPWGKNYKYRVDTSNNKDDYKVYTGHDNVQGQPDMCVVGVGQNGASDPPEVALEPTTP